eukprot:m.133380 g.133380  ORF g.133380 m.133380 type:complete len:581 (+) comp13944_c0_seq3:61-1803(+)
MRVTALCNAHHAPRPRPVVVAGVAVLLLFLQHVNPAVAKPCPHDAYFVYSAFHDSDHCACARGYSCIGSECTMGDDSNHPISYDSNSAGFPATCMDCMCVDAMVIKRINGGLLAPEQALKDARAHSDYRIIATTDGGTMRDFVDPMFDQSCHVVKQEIALPRPKALRALNWLHFPKAGTTLTNTFYHYGCRALPSARSFYSTQTEDVKKYQASTCEYCYEACKGCFTLWAPHDGLKRYKRDGESVKVPFKEKHCSAVPLGLIPGHNPLPARKLKSRAGYVLAVYRDPRKRTVSAFNYHRHSFGTNKLDRARMLNVTHNVESFINFPGIASCQTKMTLGHTCATYVKLNNADLEEAKRRVRDDLALAGLMEHWNATVCLFHRTFGGAIHPTELTNMRPATSIVDGKQGRNAASLELRQRMKKEMAREIQRLKKEEYAKIHAKQQSDDDDTMPPVGGVGVNKKGDGMTSRQLFSLASNPDKGTFNVSDKILHNDNESLARRHILSADFPIEDASETLAVDENEVELEHTFEYLGQVDKAQYKAITRDHDPFDWDLYIHVQKVFVERLNQYGFEIPKELKHLL